MAAAVAAQTSGFHAINLPAMYEDVPACSTYTVKWTPSTNAAYDGPVTFGLIGGATQQTLVPIGSNFGSVVGSVGQYAWNVPCDAGADAIYGLKIFLASDLNTFQYSMPFHIVANGGSATSKSAGSATSKSAGSATTETSACEETPETTTCEETPTGHDSYNSTMTTMTTMASPVTTSPTNGTNTTHKPSGASATVTSFTTEAGSTGTGAATTTPATAGASRALSGSFAILAVAAAFFSL
jgi:hypothetical protein